MRMRLCDEYHCVVLQSGVHASHFKPCAAWCWRAFHGNRHVQFQEQEKRDRSALVFSTSPVQTQGSANQACVCLTSLNEDGCILDLGMGAEKTGLSKDLARRWAGWKVSVPSDRLTRSA